MYEFKGSEACFDPGFILCSLVLTLILLFWVSQRRILFDNLENNLLGTGFVISCRLLWAINILHNVKMIFVTRNDQCERRKI